MNIFFNSFYRIVLTVVISFAPMHAVHAMSTVSMSGNTAIQKMIGDYAGDQLGAAVSLAGDINCDGYDDMYLTAPLYDRSSTDPDAGAIYIFYGNENFAQEDVSIANADARLIGQNASHLAGLSVQASGDIDGDTCDDLLIGAPQANSYKGKVYIFYGSSTALSGDIFLGNANAIWVGSSAGDLFSQISTGDINGDNYDDIVVGAPGSNAMTGAVYILYGDPTRFSGTSPVSAVTPHFEGAALNDIAGGQVAVGDLNGDDLDDLLISAPQATKGAKADVGIVYLVYGQKKNFTGATPLSSSTAVAAKFTGEEKNHLLGYFSLNFIGDVNGDGFNDAAVGAHGYDAGGTTERGAVYILHGQNTLLSGTQSIRTAATTVLEGENAGDGVSQIVGVGDVNADGYDDMVVGAPGTNAFTGSAYLYYGSTATIVSGYAIDRADAEFTGEQVGSYFGSRIAAGGDVNGDGHADLLMGAYEYDDTGTASNEGAAYFMPSQKPQLSFVEGATSTHVCGTPYTDSGVVALDQYTQTPLAVTTAGTVSGMQPEVAVLTYTTAKNIFGLASTTQRTVTVQDSPVCNPAIATQEKGHVNTKATIVSSGSFTSTTAPVRVEIKGKYLSVYRGETLLDKKKVSKKKLKKKRYRLSVVKMYKKKPYTTVVLLHTKKKKAVLTVYRLSKKNLLKKRARKTFVIHTVKPVKVRIKQKKKRIVTKVGKKGSVVKKVWKLTKKGKLKLVVPAV